MSLFERLLCLDADLAVLGTKLFVAKEEIKDAILYPESKYVSIEENEWEEEESMEIDEVEETSEEQIQCDKLKNKPAAIAAKNRIRSEEQNE